MKERITYKTAGVDIDAATESLRRIRGKVKATHGKSVLEGLGSFGSLFDLSSVLKDFDEPVLVQSVDGVGTKLMVANLVGRHDSVGVDIVNHCCDDILCQGARPLTFLDYVAVENLDPSQIEEIVGGMAKACLANGVALVGGETAELPGMYVKGEYDLAGVITGVVEKSKILTGRNIAPGDAIIGLKSSGLHTNGYTLARKVFFGELKLDAGDHVEEFGRTLGEELLEPHRDYSRVLWPLLQNHPVRGLAHITGGGFVDNIPRALPKNVDAVINLDSWIVPPVFRMIQKKGGAPDEDMFRTFNMGIGMVIFIAGDAADKLVSALKNAGEEAIMLGETTKGGGKTILA